MVVVVEDKDALVIMRLVLEPLMKATLVVMPFTVAPEEVEVVLAKLVQQGVPILPVPPIEVEMVAMV